MAETLESIQVPNEPRIFSAWPKHEFFEIKRNQAADLAFADVRVATGPSDFEDTDVDLTTRFTRGIEIKNPFVSAVMDTVTEKTMAIELGRLGSLGVLHSRFSAEEQREQVRKVKLSQSWLINDPITFESDRTLSSILEESVRRDFDFSTFPITERGALVGILTGDDFRRSKSRAESVTAGQAMTSSDRLITLPEGTDEETAYKVMDDKGVDTIPLIGDGRSVAGLYLWRNLHEKMTGVTDSFSIDKLGRLITAAAFETREEETVERVRSMIKYLDIAVIDTSKGDHKYALRTLKLLKEEFGDSLQVMVGNVSEPEGAYELAMAGADGIKVGQGPGSICTTRMEIGIGAPQVTAIYNCVEAVRGLDVPICADGGIQNGGDLVVALAAGASTVMAGGVFAATKETPGEIITDQATGAKYKIYRGQGSLDVLKERVGGGRGYGSGDSVLLPEGVTKKLPYRGEVRPIVLRACEAMKRGISMGRYSNVNDFREFARFRNPSPAGLAEGKPHDVDDISNIVLVAA
jgi:IMP dehydrogenase